MKPFRFSRAVWAAVLVWSGVVAPALAHDPGLSTVTVQWQPGALDVVLVFSLKDAETLTGLNATRDPAASSLGTVALEALEILCDGRRTAAAVAGSRFDGGSNATVELRMAVGTSFTLRSKCFALLPAGHRQFVTIQDARGQVLASKLLSASSDSMTFALPADSAGSAAPRTLFADFLLLGMKHIVTGYDHLLFLFSLLLVTRRVAPALKIITAFTVAHSITLALAALNVVRVPAAIVEPVIAASIIYVGIENLVRGEMPKGRALLTFAFGLIHGLGFASALSEAGLGHGSASGIVGPLLLFNLGVELGQLAVAAVTLPLLWKVSVHPGVAKRWVPACSALVILAGGYWLAQRLG